MQPVPILMYHSVADKVDPRYRTWSVTVSRFAAHMAMLADNGYSVFGVSTAVSRLRAGLPLPDKYVVLTFDDGLQDFLSGAVPVLDTYGFQATLYVVAGAVDRTSDWLTPLGEGERPMLTAEELSELHANGVEIGAHSYTHPELDLLDRIACANEIRASRLALENMIGAQVLSFAYPYGYASRTTRALVQEAGFQSAVRVRHALSDISENRFGLSRLIVTHDLDETGLLALIQGRGVPVAPSLDRFSGTCWRIARRWRKRLGNAQVAVSGHSMAGGMS